MSGYLLRSMMFVPGYNRKFLDRAQIFRADALILDVEDSVPAPNKGDARRYIREYLESGAYQQRIFIRVNALDTGMLMDDLRATMHDAVEGYMFSKATCAADLQYYDTLLGQLEQECGYPVGKFRMCPLIECAMAVLDARAIAASSSRMVGMAFGGEDYLRDLDGLHTKHNMNFVMPRSLIAASARAADIDPIDTPFLDVHNEAGFTEEVMLARDFGFSGILTIHPSQIEIANALFSPSEDDIAMSKRIIDAIEESSRQGKGVTLLDGQLIGPPMEKRARQILDKARAMQRM